MVKVLNIISDTNIGGAGRVLLNYLRCADRSTFTPETALPRGSLLKPELERLGGKVYELEGGADRSLDPAAVPEMARLIRETNPDLVHTHGSLSGRLAARLCGKPVLYTKHCAFPPSRLASSPPGRLAGHVLDGLLSDGVIAIGDSAREVLQLTGVPEKKIHVLYNGVTPLPPPGPGEREAVRREYSFAPEDFVLGSLARMEPYKGQSLLLEAAALLLARGRQVKVLLAGAGSCEEQLRGQAGRELPPGTVCFAGFVQQPERALWGMDVQVSASTQSETSSLSLLEGMSLGLPAVASDVGGNPYLIRDGENGLIFPRGDAAALAGCVQRLMDEPETRRYMGRRAGEIFKEQFTGERFARNVEAVYRTALEVRRHG